MKNQSTLLQTAVRPTRVCSGGCAYFQPVYESGRKVAGAGTCSRLASEAAVSVGITCLWGSAMSTLAGRVIPLIPSKREAATA